MTMEAYLADTHSNRAVPVKEQQTPHRFGVRMLWNATSHADPVNQKNCNNHIIVWLQAQERDRFPSTHNSRTNWFVLFITKRHLRINLCFKRHYASKVNVTTNSLTRVIYNIRECCKATIRTLPTKLNQVWKQATARTHNFERINEQLLQVAWNCNWRNSRVKTGRQEPRRPTNKWPFFTLCSNCWSRLSNRSCSTMHTHLVTFQGCDSKLPESNFFAW